MHFDGVKLQRFCPAFPCRLGGHCGFSFRTSVAGCPAPTPGSPVTEA